MKKMMIMLVMLVFTACLAVGCSKKEETDTGKTKKTATEKEVSATDKKEEPEEEKIALVIGTQSAEAFDILLKNSTGQDITAVTIKTSDKAEWPANMMKEGETLKNGEIAEVYYTPEKATADTASATDKAINIVYTAQITLADGKNIELSAIGFDDIEAKSNVELCYEEEVGYIKYASKASGDPVSTKEQEIGAKAQKAAQAEAEKAAQEAAAAAAAQDAANAAAQSNAAPQQNAPAETYTEPTYTEPTYTAPEPAYTEPAYTPQEPVYTEPPVETPAQGSEGCLDGGAAINPQY